MINLARLGCILVALAALWAVQPTVHAQSEDVPTLEVESVDATAFPTVEISLAGSGLPAAIGDLPLQVLEDEQVQTIASDRVEAAPAQLAVVIDPRGVYSAGVSGQSRHTEMVGAVLDLVQQDMLVRNQDRLAVFSAGANGEPVTVQDWTDEPNLLFNSIVQTPLDEIPEGAASPDFLAPVLEEFYAVEDQTYPLRSIILFAAGANPYTATNAIDLANQLHVNIDVIELAGSYPAGQDSPLRALAAQTGGSYVYLASTQNLEPLWSRLREARSRRIISYESSAAQPQTVQVKLALPDGSSVTADASLDIPVAAGEPIQPGYDATSTPVEEPAPAPTEAPTAVPATAASAPLSSTTMPDSGAGETVDGVPIPGTSLVLPRIALQLALPVLVLLLVYFLYRELRERRKKRMSDADWGRGRRPVVEQSHSTPNPTIDLKPLAKGGAKSAGPGEQQADVAHRGFEPAAPAGSDRDDAFDDGLTMLPPGIADDEATFRRAEEVEQPLLGTLIRVTNKPSLPRELPIYGLGAGGGEARRIYIGRHSKRNTIVINDQSVSREHAFLVQKEGRLYLCDNASTGGTFLNWRRLSSGEELLLRHNDLIGFGEIIYEFRAKGEDEATMAGRAQA